MEMVLLGLVPEPGVGKGEVVVPEPGFDVEDCVF